MPTPTVPSATTMLADAAPVINLGNETYRYGVLAGAIGAANVGTPLPPSSTTQQLLNYIGGILQSQIPSNLLSVFIQQLLTFLYRNSVLVGSAAVNGTITSGAFAISLIPVVGAEPGDFVDVSTSAAFGTGPYQFTAFVSTNDLVTVRTYNPSGFTDLSLTGKTMYVRVTKRAS